jgi:hypothetical protein
MRFLPVLLLLAACASKPVPAPPRPPLIPPLYLQTCKGPVIPPNVPPAPRTVAQLSEWAVKIFTAYQRAEAARENCAGRLALLNAWIARQAAALENHR